MYNHIENNAALILAVCYGIQPDVAAQMTNCCGNRKKQDEIIKKELHKFFDKNYEVIRKVFLDRIEENMSTKELAKKYDVSVDTIRSYLMKAEIYYLEFKGLIELGMLAYYDHVDLMAFLTRYGRFYVKEQKKNDNFYGLLKLYEKGQITLNALKRETHMTLNALYNI